MYTASLLFSWRASILAVGLTLPLIQWIKRTSVPKKKRRGPKGSATSGCAVVTMRALNGSHNSVVNVVTRPRAGWSGVRTSAGSKVYFSSKTSDLAPGCQPSLLFSGYRRILLRRESKRDIRLATHFYLVPLSRMTGDKIPLPTWHEYWQIYVFVFFTYSFTPTHSWRNTYLNTGATVPDFKVPFFRVVIIPLCALFNRYSIHRRAQQR
jgi:hypothetical protein